MNESMDAFDSIAEEYHSSFSLNGSAKLARTRVHQSFTQYLSPAQGVVLDVGCGTGIDAQFIAGLGCDVYGIDKSVGMIGEAVKQLNLSNKTIGGKVELEAVVANTKNLNLLLSSIRAKHVILSFGVINFIEDLQSLFQVIALHLDRGGICIATALSKSSWWEYLRKGGSVRIGTQPKSMSIGGVETSSWFWDDDDIVSASQNFFDVVDVYGIGFVYPPPYLDKYVCRFPRLQRLLWKLDRQYERSKLAAKYADHVVVVLERQHAGY